MTCTCKRPPSKFMADCIANDLPPRLCSLLDRVLTPSRLRHLGKRGSLDMGLRLINSYLDNRFGPAEDDDADVYGGESYKHLPPAPEPAMPLVQQRAEERYRVRGFDRPEPITIVGFANVYDWPHHAGFADSSGNFRFHRFTPGCFAFAATQPCKLLVDHCELPTIATTDNGTMKLTDTPMGLLVEATISNAKIIQQIEVGEIAGLSVMAIPREKYEHAGVIVHKWADLEEISLCTKAPGNPLTALVAVNRPISTATQQALNASATPLEQRRAGVIRELLNVRQRLLAL